MLRTLYKIMIKAEEGISQLLMVGIVFLVFLAGVLRWIGFPVPWSVDLAQLLFIWLIFIGANQAMRNHGHIGVDFFVKRFPQKLTRIVELMMLLCISLFLIFVIFYGVQLSLANATRLINNLYISYAFVTLAVPCGSAMMLVTVLRKMFHIYTSNCVETNLDHHQRPSA